MYGQGGALGYLMASMVDAKINADRAKRVEARMGDLRDAMADFNPDPLANVATAQVISFLPWFAARGEPILIHDGSAAARNDALENSIVSGRILHVRLRSIPGALACPRNPGLSA